MDGLACAGFFYGGPPMSLQARQFLVRHPHTFFQQPDVMHADLLDSNRTKTTLIALLVELVNKGHIIEFTMIRTGHHNDGPNGHNPGGRAADCWPLASAKAGDYLDATDPRFQKFIDDAASSVWLYQEGLVGDGADSDANFSSAERAAQQHEPGRYEAGVTIFHDDGGAHVHVGAVGA